MLIGELKPLILSKSRYWVIGCSGKLFLYNKNDVMFCSSNVGIRLFNVIFNQMCGIDNSGSYTQALMPALVLVTTMANFVFQLLITNG